MKLTDSPIIITKPLVSALYIAQYHKIRINNDRVLQTMIDNMPEKIRKSLQEWKTLLQKKEFVLLKPTTKTRIDLGLKLKNVPITHRFLDSGLFGTMCTHCVQLTSTDDLGDELKAWLTEAPTQMSINSGI